MEILLCNGNFLNLFFFFNLNVPCDFHSSDEQTSSLAIANEYVEWITDTGDENEPIRNRLPVF